MIIFYILLFATNVKADFGEELISTNRNLKTYVEICQAQNDRLIKNSFKELSKSQNATEYFQLKIGYKRLAKILDEFKIEKQSTSKEIVFRKLIYDKCSKKNLQIFRQYQRKIYSCRNAFDLYHFLEAAIYATGRKDFPKKLKAKARKLIVSYIREEAGSDTTIINHLMGFDLLIQAAKYNIIDKKLSSQIDVFRSKSIEDRKTFLEFQVKIKGEKLYNCSRVKKLMKLEKTLSLKMRDRLKFLIDLIEK